MKMTVGEIASLINAEVEGDTDLNILGPGKIEEGNPGELCFYANPKYEAHIYSTNCSAILVDKNFKLLQPITKTLLRVENVYAAIGVLLNKFSTELTPPKGISKNTTISASTEVGKGTTIGDFAIIGEQVTIGTNTVIHGQVFIGNDCKIGNNCLIYPGVKIYQGTVIGDNCIVHSNAVLGSDGFGFSSDNDGNYTKIPQTGIVVLEDNVEIGACTIIDRATMGQTLVKSGVKLDNLIQIAHNAEIGKNTVIAAQSGVSGSTKIGANCMVGGQVGFVGHISIADGSMFQAKTGVASNISEPNKKYYGYPAMGYQDYLKSYTYFKKFPEIVDKIRSLEKEIDTLRDSIKKD